MSCRALSDRNVTYQMPDREITGNSFFFGPKASIEKAFGSAREKLVARVRAGDEEAFGELYREFSPLVHGILIARLPRQEVQDIVQEVFLSAYKNIGSLKDENALGGWLARIARNHVAEHYRRSRPEDELPEEMPGKGSRHAEAADVMRAIRSLPEAYSETLTLRLVEGMTGNEIAAATGLKPESVRVNLHRGMEMLRQKLGITEANK